MKFSKMAIMGGWEIFARNRRKPVMGGGGVINGEDGKIFKVS